jgi:hypothetical protein
MSLASCVVETREGRTAIDARRGTIVVTRDLA